MNNKKEKTPKCEFEVLGYDTGQLDTVSAPPYPINVQHQHNFGFDLFVRRSPHEIGQERQSGTVIRGLFFIKPPEQD